MTAVQQINRRPRKKKKLFGFRYSTAEYDEWHLEVGLKSTK